MAIQYTIATHGVAYPSKVLARNGGAHIYNILASEDLDNGWIVGKGAFQSLDLYAEAAPTTLTGTVVDQAANGNWYVEIVTATNALLVYNVPLIEEEYNRNFQKEENFYNPNGTVVRSYTLCPGDVIELSASAMSGSITKGASVALKAITGATAKQLGV